jgi:hypothetical protein
MDTISDMPCTVQDGFTQTSFRERVDELEINPKPIVFIHFFLKIQFEFDLIRRVRKRRLIN